jgi:hypothetical protein
MKLCVPPSDAAALKCLVAAHAGNVAVERAPAGKGEVRATYLYFCNRVSRRKRMETFQPLAAASVPPRFRRPHLC